MSRLSTLMELAAFLRARKKYWIAPILMLLVLLGTALVLAEGSAAGPLIYTIF